MAVPLIVAAGLTGVSVPGAAAVSCAGWTGAQPPNPGGPDNDNALTSVAVLSACDVWAVGGYFNGTGRQTLAVHWNGSAWDEVTTPDPGGLSGFNTLLGVTAVSSRNIWAVGFYFNGTADQTLIVHWNGSVWRQVPSPDPGGAAHDNLLLAVQATSSRNVWAVGDFVHGTAHRTLAVHWNGSAWKVLKTPDPSATADQLSGVAASSARDAWAVGFFFKGTAQRALVLHWNGSAWKLVNPRVPSGSALTAVRATSARDAWAAGNAAQLTLVLHWNGSAWKVVKSPSPSATENSLTGITATSARSAWAVGAYAHGTAGLTLVLHWNGSAWTQVKSPNQSSGGNFLTGVGATSATNVWAVGFYSSGIKDQTFAVHCC